MVEAGDQKMDPVSARKAAVIRSVIYEEGQEKVKDEEGE